MKFIEYIESQKFLNELNENWESIAPYLLDFNDTIPHNQHAQTAIKSRKHYLGENPINLENVQSLVRMVSDRIFKSDAGKSARMQAKVNKSPVYFYYFSYRGAHSISDAYSGTTKNFGSSYCYDC
jgi:carboxylesterase type B